MTSIEGDVSKMSMDADLSFLDLKDCSHETRTFILGLLEDESKPKKPVNPSSSAPATTATLTSGTVTQSQQQQPAQHHYQQVLFTYQMHGMLLCTHLLTIREIVFQMNRDLCIF